MTRNQMRKSLLQQGVDRRTAAKTAIDFCRFYIKEEK